ncbi:MAG: hypothetical protein U9Q17_03050, partial [Chloroflexota bacterium]|nr:hypothetical protein [Chloroflexota bacterium]
MAGVCLVNLWVNEDRYDRLNKLGMAGVTRDMLAGMKVLQLQCSAEQKDKMLALYPMAKWDSATTGSIELLPAEAKDKLFDMV